MVNRSLQQKFFSLLQKQPGFIALDEDRKKRVVNRFADATDEQILQAVGALKLLEDESSDKTFSDEDEQRLAEEALQIGHEMKNIDREQLQMDEAKDKETTDNDAEKLLKALDKIDTPSKKKIFGVF
jgi:hypothetical protein